MGTITKEKNYLIYEHQGKQYKFNIDNGQFTSMQTDKTVSKTPNGFATTLSEKKKNSSTLLRFIYLMHTNNKIGYTDFGQYAHYMQICDKLDSLNFPATKLYIGWNYQQTFKELEMVENHLKEFIEVVNDDRYTNSNFTFLANELQTRLTEKKWNLREDIRDTFMNIYKSYDYTDEQLKLIIYWLERGLNIVWADAYNISHRLTTFFQKAQKIGYMPEKSDFYRQYVMVHQTYEANKIKYESESIQTQLGKHSHIWDFETDELCIVVPKTAEDFRDEANQQGNCVYRSYLPDVVNGETNIVFIRKKDDIKKSYITCEIDNDGRIVQYLTKYNGYIGLNDIGYQFKIDFQKFIKENWNR